MIDTHCHIDLYPIPLALARECEAGMIRTVAVTYLPSHYRMAKQHLKGFNYVRPALGLHPHSVKDHEKELPIFVREARDERLIGEIGLDFAPAFISSKMQQEAMLVAVLDCLRGKQRFVTLHSRRAEDALLAHLRDANIEKAVFHWFSGSRAQLIRVLDAGHFVSINPAMIATSKWDELISVVPRDRVLTESDGPFAKHNGQPATPGSTSAVLAWLSAKWNMPVDTVRTRISRVFDSILPGLFG